MEESEFRYMIEVDDRHWWYRGRRRVIHAQLARLGLAGGLDILDAGCGSGRTMDELCRYGTVSGFDLEPAGVEAARSRGHSDVGVARLEQTGRPDEAFDLITCLDVVEHTPDDVASLHELRRVARRGGHLLLTVPAFQALWSEHDIANHHFRRYRWATLKRAALAAGWEPVSSTYFNTLLLAPAAVVRLAARMRGLPEAGDAKLDTRLTPGALDGVLERQLALEAAAIARGVRLPAGLSLMAILRKS